MGTVPKNLREWVIRAQGGVDQTTLITEERGVHRSQQRGEHVDHIIPESQLLFEGKCSTETPMILRSRQHHVGEGLDESGNLAPYGHPAWSRHPDIGKAQKEYERGDRTAFARALKKHKEAVANGRSITNDDWGVQNYEIEKVKDLEWKYHLRHPEDPRPTTKGKKPIQHKHWTDFFFGTRKNSADEGS